MIRHLFAALSAGFLTAAVAAPACAHAFLQKASPAVGSTIAAAPAELWIEFTEEVEPGFSSIEVTNAAGARVDSGGPVHSGGSDGARLVIGLTRLAAGSYKVVWRVTAIDTHRTQGSYSFTIRP